MKLWAAAIYSCCGTHIHKYRCVLDHVFLSNMTASASHMQVALANTCFVLSTKSNGMLSKKKW